MAEPKATYTDEFGNLVIESGPARIYVGPTEPPLDRTGLWVKTDAGFTKAEDLLFNNGAS